MKLKVYPENCCEVCGEIIHNHFDCPECGVYASSDVYEALYDVPKNKRIMTCKNCGAQYQLIDGEPYSPTAEWFKL